jgi:hypothetical protein
MKTHIVRFCALNEISFRPLLSCHLLCHVHAVYHVEMLGAEISLIVLMQCTRYFSVLQSGVANHEALL